MSASQGEAAMTHVAPVETNSLTHGHSSRRENTIIGASIVKILSLADSSHLVQTSQLWMHSTWKKTKTLKGTKAPSGEIQSK